MKLLITGSNGLVGSALKQQNTQFDLITIDRSYDLRYKDVVQSLFEYYKPDYVIHTAANVGGVGGNALCPLDYYYDNMLMNTYIIDACCKFNVNKLYVFSSVCAFPDTVQILEEDRLHDGPPSKFNTEYAYAKRMVDIQIQAAQKQRNITGFTSIIPVNIFGENDCYNINTGHVIPSLIHKIYRAKQDGLPVEIWGDGSAKREFIYSQDLANILLSLLHQNIPDKLIISNSIEYNIKDIVTKLCKIANYDNITWNTNKPNGQLKRPSNTKRLQSLLNYRFTDIDEALTNSYKWFEQHYPKVRQ